MKASTAASAVRITGLVRWTVVDLVKQTIAYRAYRAPDETAPAEEVAR